MPALPISSRLSLAGWLSWLRVLRSRCGSGRALGLHPGFLGWAAPTTFRPVVGPGLARARPRAGVLARPGPAPTLSVVRPRNALRAGARAGPRPDPGSRAAENEWAGASRWRTSPRPGRGAAAVPLPRRSSRLPPGGAARSVGREGRSRGGGGGRRRGAGGQRGRKRRAGRPPCPGGALRRPGSASRRPAPLRDPPRAAVEASGAAGLGGPPPGRRSAVLTGGGGRGGALARAAVSSGDAKFVLRGRWRRAGQKRMGGAGRARAPPAAGVGVVSLAWKRRPAPCSRGHLARHFLRPAPSRPRGDALPLRLLCGSPAAGCARAPLRVYRSPGRQG